jgi:hypothetical protein
VARAKLTEDTAEKPPGEELGGRGVQVEQQLPVRILSNWRMLRKPLRLDREIAGLGVEGLK